MDFPNSLSAGDGKHIRIFGFPSSWLLYFIYLLSISSIGLLGVVGAGYWLRAIDLGKYGRERD